MDFKIGDPKRLRDVPGRRTYFQGGDATQEKQARAVQAAISWACNRCSTPDATHVESLHRREIPRGLALRKVLYHLYKQLA